MNGKNGIKHFLNPQQIKISPDEKFLYIACSGSHSLVIFKQDTTGNYAHFQSVINSEVSNSALHGASSIAISKTGEIIIVAGETGQGLAIFEWSTDGTLESKNIKLMSNDQRAELVSVSSIEFSHDDQYLLVTSAKNDSLSVYKLSKK